MIKVLYISGSRADYGPVRHVLKAINNNAELDVSVLVTGMHLDPLHGETWQEIATDGFKIAEQVHGRSLGDSLTEMAASIGSYLNGMSYAISRIQPNIILVLGDRGEQLAGSMAGVFHNITVVHLCGGSISGSIDDSIRHAITKFAHYHLPALEEHANRIVQMGEDPERVQVVGLPGNDIKSDVKFTHEQVCTKFNLSIDKPYILVVQHPVTFTQNEVGQQIEETLEAVRVLENTALLSNPNDDAGGRTILEKMSAYANDCSNLHVLPPLSSRELFASVMAHSGVMVGNSSAGIVEAMSLGVPVVNIGDRQRGREHLACLINVGYDRSEIRNAIEVALLDDTYRSKLADFSANMLVLDTPTEVVKFLLSVDLGVALRPKTFFDSPVILS